MNGSLRGWATIAALAFGAGSLATWSGAPAHGQASGKQSVLGPGLYVYQTRTRSAECDDDERTGFVSSFVATIDGVPGDREMKMELINSTFWPMWNLKIEGNDQLKGLAKLKGDASASAYSEFDMKRDAKGRFTGVGTRYYNATIQGQKRRCSVTYDVLLKPLD